MEYIIIDGGSSDNTLSIINKHAKRINVLISEPDKGIYDAMNKGIMHATGDIIGILNADDLFADDSVLDTIASAFIEHQAEITYGDLEYIDQKDKVIRQWNSGKYKYGMFNWGWMPPHPTFYCKKELFDKFGLYSLDFGTAADYELMTRFMHLHKIDAFYIKRKLIKMKSGGISNKSYRNRVKALWCDFKAMRKNRILYPILSILLKPTRKISQYF